MIASTLHNLLKNVQCGKRILIQISMDADIRYYEVLSVDIADGGELIIAADNSREAMIE